MFFLVLALLVQVTVCRELLDVASTNGFLNKAVAQVGTPVEFEGTLRVSKKQNLPVKIVFENEIDDQIFGIFPSLNVTSGRKFGLFVKDPTLLPTSNLVNVTLVASDSAKSDQQVQLVIHLEDGQLETPELDALEYNIHVAEFKTSGVLKKFKIRNAQKTRLNKFVYKLSGEHSDLFSVDAVDPDQILFSKIGCKRSDCKQLPNVFPLLLTIYSNSTNALPSKALFVIYKATSEQKKATFKDSTFNFTLKENNLLFDKLARVETADGNIENLFFQIEPTSNHFGINQRNGVLSVQKPITQKEFGNETTLNVQLRSIDNQNLILDVAKITIQILKSDKLPPGKSLRFEQKIYAFALTPGQTQIGRVEVTHQMEMVRYRIVEGGATEIEIDEKTGQLTYIGHQHAQSKNYTLKVIAVAGEQTDLATIEILAAGMGSNPPNFPISFNFIEMVIDNATKLSNIFEFKAKDADLDANLQYRLINADCVDVFGQTTTETTECTKHVKIQSNGVVSLISSKQLQELNAIQMQVGCNDTKHPIESEAKAQLLIRFKRNRPVLDKQSTVQFDSTILKQLQLPRNLIPGAYIRTIAVQPVARRFRTQQNAQFTLDADSSRYFAIDEVTGIITTKESLSDAPSRLNISVTATNSINSHQNSLNISVQIVDTHKDVPSFSENFVEFSLVDDSQVGEVVGVVRANSGQVVYKIVEDSTKMNTFFNISKNGKITLIHPISASSNQQMKFFVSATNPLSEVSSILPIHIHLTESESKEPKFTQSNYNLKIVENAPVGTFVHKFFVDKTQQILTFSLMPEDTKAFKLMSLLSIDQNGVMKTSGMLHQLSDQYSFTVVASSAHQNGSASLTLEVLSTQSCQPKFIESQSTVLYLNSTSTSTLGRFVAETQKDCELHYELDSPFLSINQTNGEVKIKHSSQFEATQQRYPLIVKAKSGTQVARLSAELRVDANRQKMLLENQLHYQVSENQKADSKIGSLLTEPKTNVKFRLMNLSNDFIVDATTGQLKTKHPLDRELQEQHNLTVEVIDSLNSKQVDSAQVLIDVLDINDNPPKFNSDQFEVVLEKRAMPGQIIFKTKAVDLDGGEADRLIYKLESQTYIFGKNKVNSNAFEIADPTSGEVILSKSILDVGGMFELVISVSDLNEDLAHISRATIKIWICDSSDIGKFVFEQSARDLNHANVEKYLHDLETILQVRPIFKDAKYHLTKDGPDSTSVILEILFVNSRTQKIIPFARIEKQLSSTELNGIKILNDESIAELTQQQTVEESHGNVTSASLLIAALIFLILLCVVMSLFVAIVYSHKRRFNRHKQICESMKVAAEMSGKQLPSQMSEPPTYKTLGETRTNPMLLQEIESSATSIYNIGFSDSSLPTRQHSVNTR